MMTIDHKALLNVEALPEYAETRQRFEAGFGRFVTLKKEQAVCLLLPQELSSETLVRNLDFIQAIASRVDDEAILEKRYIFLSLNPNFPA